MSEEPTVNEATENQGVGDSPAAEPEFDRSSLESKLSEQMAAFNAADENYALGHLDEEPEEDVQDAPEADTDDSDEVGDDTEEVIEAELDDDTKVVDTDGGEESNSEEQLSGLTIPAAHIRSLKAYGYDDARIAKNAEKFGLDFNTFAADIHSKRNAEVARWAEAGQRQREMQQQPAESVQQNVAPTQAAMPQQLQPIDLAKLQEKYGEAELLQDLIGPVNATINTLNAVIPGIQQGMQTVQRTQEDAVTTQINSFFDSKEIEPYRKLYGGSDKPMTQEQIATRNQMLDMADLILSGAASQGQNLSFEAAMTAAHDAVSANFRETAVRKTIKKVAKARNRGITQKPSKRVVKPASSGDDRTDFERRTAARMRDAFKNV